MDDDTQSGWEYKPDGGDQKAALDDHPAPSASHGRHPRKHKTNAWEAPEFIEHNHGGSWYSALVLSTLILAVVVFFAAGHDIFAVVIVVVLGAIVGSFAGHKPGIAKYEISSSGLSINGKTYRYGDYKSFSIIREGELSSVNLMPLKRFMPPVAAYFDPAKEKAITNALGEHLPYEQRQLDAIERLSRRLRL